MSTKASRRPKQSGSRFHPTVGGTSIDLEVGDMREIVEALRAAQNKDFAYVRIFNQSLLSMADLAKSGLSASFVKVLARDLFIDQTVLLEHLGIPRSTYNRKLRDNRNLGTGESERVLGMAKLVGQVQSMVEGSGNREEFDAKKWVGEWLEQPVPALGNRRPLELMGTVAGQQLVSQVLSQAQSGAYA